VELIRKVGPTKFFFELGIDFADVRQRSLTSRGPGDTCMFRAPPLELALTAAQGRAKAGAPRLEFRGGTPTDVVPYDR
jgi:hypothetical protein